MKRLIREHLRRRVVVTLKSGSSFVGVLYLADSEAIVLREATSVSADSEQVPVDGELLFLRPDVDFMQFPG